MVIFFERSTNIELTMVFHGFAVVQGGVRCGLNSDTPHRRREVSDLVETR